LPRISWHDVSSLHAATGEVMPALRPDQWLFCKDCLSADAIYVETVSKMMTARMTATAGRIVNK